MSGHSKWAKIKRKKGANDQKRGALFTKLAKTITLAAKEAGPDPDLNFSLRLAINKAKNANMPLNNIERAIEKAQGADAGAQIQKISYEAFSVSGVGILIDCQTDNTNRTVAEVKQIVEAANGKFASLGSVSWQFQEKGLITIRSAKIQKAEQYGKEDKLVDVDREVAMLELMEIAGIEDIRDSVVWDEQEAEIEALEVVTAKESFAEVLKTIEELGYKIESAELIKEAKETTKLSEDVKTSLLNLVEQLEEHDDVDAVWTAAE